MPLGRRELADLLAAALAQAARLTGRSDRAILAVSGGPDSLALLLAAVACRDSAPPTPTNFHIVTIDHNLRAESAAEARFVAEMAARFGLSHETLRWADPARTGNLAAAARQARYDHLGAAARRTGATAILTAHHEDDQFETHLMAAERGAGVVGLAGMRPVRVLAPDLALARPFLAIAGARLKATVAAHHLPAVDDPTNADPAYRRVQIRRQLAAATFDRPVLRARITAHQAQRDAVEAELSRAMAAMAAAGDLAVTEAGTVAIGRSALAALADAPAFLLVQRAVAAVGGRGQRPGGPATLRLLDAMRSGTSPTRTLGGIRVATGPTITMAREYGRAGIAPVPVGTGTGPHLFDGRFMVDPEPDLARAGARIVAFGDLGRGNAVERTLPALVAGDTLLAVPARLGHKVAGGTPPLTIHPFVDWSLYRDLPPPSAGTAGPARGRR
ncbi:tRNA lysidine(34) synthetase TilS [Aurantimonas sp. A2-1-M11]|uniref:tRNA lysidine(34) synthetase TilS n=1 Tax=Aurantimonas sp. A2-1-M11 TaxID=3113712 RepID=UPI002F95FF2C